MAVTGHLNEPTDRMEITLLSEHSTHEMFEVDYFGRTRVIPISDQYDSKGLAMTSNRNEDKGQNNQKVIIQGDEVVNIKKQAAIYATEVVDIPSRLKVELKIGYTKGFTDELKVKGEPEFEEYVEKVMAHCQSRYNHPSLGTIIQFEVQKGYLYDNNTSWCAEDSLGKAEDKTNQLKLQNVDLTTWFADSERPECGHSIVGMANIAELCGSDAVNVVECVMGATKTGYTMAHEIGHNLGMVHDSSGSNGDEYNPCMYLDDWDGSIGFSPCNRYDFEHSYAEEFWGHGCLEDISRPCTEFTCENEGTCSATKDGGFTCSCPSPITGKRCENNPNPSCNGGDSCCTSENKCKEWEGDCDDDDDCLDGLICGKENCPRKYGYDWDKTDDCCFNPDKQTTTTTCNSKAINGKGETGNCVFPFYIDGIKYNNCANADDEHEGGTWCSFDRIYDDKWGYCTNECPIGTCKAQSLDCPPIKKGNAKQGAGHDGTCVFPFKYDNRYYHKCADGKDFGGRGWCAFDPEFKGFDSDRWGYCTDECPSNYADPCDEIVCNVPNETCVDGICKCGSSCSCEGSITASFCDSENSQCKCSATEDACEENLFCDISDGKCKRCIGQDDCCTKDKKCDVGEGGCSRSYECKQGLKCGTNNCCKGFVGSDWNWGNNWEMVKSGKCGFWGPTDDCCYDPICIGGDSCCTKEFPCGVGEGDCDNDNECEEGLKCGDDNCNPCPEGMDCSEFETDDDCCVPK